MTTTTYETGKALESVASERAKQDEKWGEQNWEDGTDVIPGYWATEAKDAQEWTDQATADGIVTWKDILWEEICESFAETDPNRLDEELTQAAAVIVAWKEAIARRLRDND